MQFSCWALLIMHWVRNDSLQHRSLSNTTKSCTIRPELHLRLTTFHDHNIAFHWAQKKQPAEANHWHCMNLPRSLKMFYTLCLWLNTKFIFMGNETSFPRFIFALMKVNTILNNKILCVSVILLTYSLQIYFGTQKCMTVAIWVLLLGREANHFFFSID